MPPLYEVSRHAAVEFQPSLPGKSPLYTKKKKKTYYYRYRSNGSMSGDNAKAHSTDQAAHSYHILC